MQQMSIDYEAVGAVINQIDVHIADINARNKKFIDLLSEKNSQTKGKFSLIKALQERVEDAAKNISETVNACETIKESLRSYAALAEEANDDSEFRV